jgi:hypothetical protein
MCVQFIRTYRAGPKPGEAARAAQKDIAAERPVTTTCYTVGPLPRAVRAGIDVCGKIPIVNRAGHEPGREVGLSLNGVFDRTTAFA